MAGETWRFWETADGLMEIAHDGLGIAFKLDELQDFDHEGFVELLNMYRVGASPAHNADAALREALQKIADSPHGTLHCTLRDIALKALRSPATGEHEHQWSNVDVSQAPHYGASDTICIICGVSKHHS